MIYLWDISRFTLIPARKSFPNILNIDVPEKSTGKPIEDLLNNIGK